MSARISVQALRQHQVVRGFVGGEWYERVEITEAARDALVDAVEAAQRVLDEYRAPRPGGVVEAVMELDTAITDRFDFGDAA